MGDDSPRRRTEGPGGQDGDKPVQRFPPKRPTLTYGIPAVSRSREPEATALGASDAGRRTMLGTGMRSQTMAQAGPAQPAQAGAARAGRSPLDIRLRPYRPVRYEDLIDLIDPEVGWMTEDQRIELRNALLLGELTRAHDQLVALQERYPKNLTIKKALALFRSQVRGRYEEVLGGLHVVPRKTDAFRSSKRHERERIADFVDGETPVEGVLRKSKCDRLRGLEVLTVWFKSGEIEIVEPRGGALSAGDGSSLVVYEKANVREARRPPPVADSATSSVSGYSHAAREREPPAVSSFPRAGLRALAGGQPTQRPTPVAFPPPAPLPSLELEEAPDSREPESSRLTLSDPIEAANQIDHMLELESPVPQPLVAAPVKSELQAQEAPPTSKPAPEPPTSETPTSETQTSEPPKAVVPSPGPSMATPLVAEKIASVRPTFARQDDDDLEPAAARFGLVHLGIAGLVVAAAAIGVYVAVDGETAPSSTPIGQRSSPPLTASASALARVPATAPTATQVGALSATASAPSKSIKLTLQIEPRHARVTLDGKALSLKSKDHLLPRDGQPHELRVEAPGYRRKKVKFNADADTRLVVSLDVAQVTPQNAPHAPEPESTAPAPGIYD